MKERGKQSEGALGFVHSCPEMREPKEFAVKNDTEVFSGFAPRNDVGVYANK